MLNFVVEVTLVFYHVCLLTLWLYFHNLFLLLCECFLLFWCRWYLFCLTVFPSSINTKYDWSCPSFMMILPFWNYLFSNLILTLSYGFNSESFVEISDSFCVCHLKEILLWSMRDLSVMFFSLAVLQEMVHHFLAVMCIALGVVVVVHHFQMLFLMSF